MATLLKDRKMVREAGKVVARELTGFVLEETIRKLGETAGPEAVLAGVKETSQKLRSDAAIEGQSINKPLPEILADFERAIVQSVLVKTNHDTLKASKALGISERSLKYKIEKYGLEKMD